MMNIKKTHLVAAGLAVFSPFVTAAEPPEQQGQAGNLAYVGSNGRIGVGYDTKTKLRGEAYWVFSEDSFAAWIGEGWASGSAGGVKLNYHWTPDGATEKAASQSVRKLFAAVDQNNQRDQKLTLGGGLEQENLFFGAYVSSALSGRRTISETSSTVSDTIFAAEQDGRQYSQDIFTTTHLRLYERPYDYGVGARVGRYFNESLIRLSGGLDYEWGKDSSHQTTLSVMLEKFIANSPHSFSVNAEAHQNRGHWNRIATTSAFISCTAMNWAAKAIARNANTASPRHRPTPSSPPKRLSDKTKARKKPKNAWLKPRQACFQTPFSELTATS